MTTTSLTRKPSSAQGLALSLSGSPCHDGISTLAGELEAILRRFGGSVPVVVLLMDVERTLSYVDGPHAFVMDAVKEQPELFAWSAL